MKVKQQYVDTTPSLTMPSACSISERKYDHQHEA